MNNLELLKNFIQEVVRHCAVKDKDDRSDKEQVWCLYTHDGDRVLGRHSSKEDAERQERAVQAHKHG